jgi:alpha-beta hydrolase superfamily lysophospholipase
MGSLPRDIHINVDGVSLHGSLTLCNQSTALVLFVQGVGSGRFSPRNKYIAEQLNDTGVSTLLIDLLTPSERTIIRSRDQQSKLNWLYARLNRVVDWLLQHNDTADASLALFASNTGAAAGLKIAANRAQQLSAVVSWSGHPGLVLDSLPAIQAPTLLIAGAYDQPIVEENRNAAEHFRTICYLEIIADTGHELKEPRKRDELATLCKDWFLKYLPQQ